MRKISDEKLVFRIQKGDITAYEILVRRYQEKLLSFIYRIIYDSVQAQDLVQETLFKVYKNIQRVDTKRKFSSLLFTIAKNEAISYLRGKKHEVPLNELIQIEEEESIYEKITQREESWKLKKAIGKLEKKYQQVIRLYYYHDFSYEEIRNKLRIPINTVRTNLYRAKEQLKKELKK